MQGPPRAITTGPTTQPSAPWLCSAVCSLQSIKYNVQCAVCSMLCAVCCVQCAVCNVHSVDNG